MLRHLNKKVFYRYPLQRVWQVLTNQKALAAWLIENDFEARLGHSNFLLMEFMPRNRVSMHSLSQTNHRFDYNILTKKPGFH